MEQRDWKKTGKRVCGEAAWFMAGNLLYALALDLFLVDNNIAAGGFSGIAMVLRLFLPLRIGTILFFMNIPTLIAAAFIRGRRFALATILCSAIHSLTVNALEILPVLTDERLVASIFGGVLYGVGVVCLVRSGVSVGSTDLLVRLLVTVFPRFSVGKMTFLVDGTVVLIATIAFGDVQVALYATVTLFITNLFADKIMSGFDRADLCLVVTDHDPTQIAQELMRVLDRAVTKIDATGMYAGAERSVLMVVVRPAETFRVKRELSELDPSAFVVVAHANEVLGGGFKPLEVPQPVGRRKKSERT